MTVAQEVMTLAPTTVGPQTTLARAVSVLQALDVRHLPVVDDSGTLVGMLSDRDLGALQFPIFIAHEYIGKLQTALEEAVAEVMSAEVFVVNPETEVSEIIDLMLENRIGAVPVTNAEGTLVGIVSYVDILRALSDADS